MITIQDTIEMINQSETAPEWLKTAINTPRDQWRAAKNQAEVLVRILSHSVAQLDTVQQLRSETALLKGGR